MIAHFQAWGGLWNYVILEPLVQGGLWNYVFLATFKLRLYTPYIQRVQNYVFAEVATI